MFFCKLLFVQYFLYAILSNGSLPSQKRVTSESVSDSRSPWNADKMLDSYLLHLSRYFSLPILLLLLLFRKLLLLLVGR